MPENTILATIRELLTPVVEAQQVELYDVEFRTEQRQKALWLYIDKEGGIGLDDCERVSRAVDPVLDAHDPIPEAYMLQVSSPGINRKLIKDAHFKRHIGKPVELRLQKIAGEPKGTQKKFSGTLIGLDADSILVESPEGEALRFQRADLTYCRLVYIHE